MTKKERAQLNQLLGDIVYEMIHANKMMKLGSEWKQYIGDGALTALSGVHLRLVDILNPDLPEDTRISTNIHGTIKEIK